MKSVQQLYAEKLRTPEEAVKIVKSGDWVDYSQTSSFPIALDEALADVRRGKGGDFPRHLQNVHADSYTMEREQGYQYPHDFQNHWVDQQYLPDDLAGKRYYEYGTNKLEQAARQYWEQIKGK